MIVQQEKGFAEVARKHRSSSPGYQIRLPGVCCSRVTMSQLERNLGLTIITGEKAIPRGGYLVRQQP